MATREGRRRALEQMTIAELETFHSTKWGGRWFDKDDKAKSIASLLRISTKDNREDELDQKLDLLTDAEQQLQIQRDSLETSKSAVRAAWVSAGCAIVAIVIAVIALVVAMGE